MEWQLMKNILMAIKEIETETISSPIVKQTIELAIAHSSKVYIIHVAPPSRNSPYNIDSETFSREVGAGLSEIRESLTHHVKYMQDANVDAEALLVQGSIISKILEESERLATDLIIIGRHKQGPLYRVLMDHTDKGLLFRCNCPIMFVPV
jgi:nucleotide-binding universal stress UspA family protein